MRIRILLGLSLVWSAASFAAAPLRLIAPSADIALRGDHFATISWTADRRIDAEEWEAFLSVDGGRYYSVRITPHLDLGVRTFEFLVPNIASDDVRVLMRVGDEHIETIIEFPERFSIHPSPSTVVGPRVTAGAGPESARPGEDVVVEWASGNRAGDDVAIAESRATGPAIRNSLREEREGSAPVLTRHENATAGCRVDTSVANALFVERDVRPAFAISRNVLRLSSRLNV